MTASSTKTRVVKPSMAGMACPFFGASALESTGDSIISLITTEVGEAGGSVVASSCLCTGRA